MASQNLRNLYKSQYTNGEWAGPWWYQKLKPYIKTREEIVATLIPKTAATLLDLGCGEGNLFSLLPQSIIQATGLDLLKSRLDKAQSKFTKEIVSRKFSFTTADFDEKLPYQNNTFDIVTSISVLEYLLDPEHFLREVHRIVKPQGTFIIEVPNLAYIGERLKLLTGNLVGIAHAPGWQGGRLHHFTFAALEKALQENGFEIKRRAASGFLWKLRQLQPSLLSSDIIIVAEKKS
jgi:2-polyprenyl-3-methyl-5-hydroxy-6-metoxy-1,4-benzoquinol methylase